MVVPDYIKWFYDRVGQADPLWLWPFLADSLLWAVLFFHELGRKTHRRKKKRKPKMER